MASQTDTEIDAAKAAAAAEKAYANAAAGTGLKKTSTEEASEAQTVVAASPEPQPKKIEVAAPAAVAAPAKIAPAAVEAKSAFVAAPVKKPAPAKAAAPAKKKAPSKTSVKKSFAKKPAAKKAVTKVPVAKAKIAKAKPAAKPAAKITDTSVSPVSNLKDKIMATATKTAATDFTATVKTVAADAQTRAKAAYDKFQAYAGEMTEFTKGNVEAIVESSKILGSGVQDIARGEVEAAKGAFETATADLKAMAAVTSPTDLFKLQGEIARRNFDAAVARYSKNAETSMKLANDAFAPISNRVSLTVEKVAKVAA